MGKYVRKHDLPYDGSKMDAPPTACVADGCDRPIMARGMCGMHYARFNKHGSLEPVHHSKKYKARLYRWMKTKERFPNDVAWDSFPQFQNDIGEAPSCTQMLFKIDDGKPIGPGNFQWMERSPPRRKYRDPQYSYRTSKGKADYDRANYAKHKVRQRNSRMKKEYGIDIHQYNALLVAQNGCCAICKKPETVLKRGMPMMLSVDHDHQTGLVRGLLCTACNRGLGLLKDSKDFLLNAVSYLENHERTYGGSNVIPLKTKEN